MSFLNVNLELQDHKTIPKPFQSKDMILVGEKMNDYISNQ